jgi:hypothetical protein
LESRIAFHQTSPLSNAQHPARAATGTGKRVARIIEEATAPTGPAMPVLPEVSPEVSEEVQAEQPLVLPETEEETPAEATEEKQ